MPPTEEERELARLEVDLRRLETEYTLFFSGRSAKPPWELRSRLDAAVKKFDRLPVLTTAVRFRFSTIQSRYSALLDMWDRHQRGRDEGRGPQVAGRPVASRTHGHDSSSGRVVHATSLHDPEHQGRQLEELYESFRSARRETGAADVPFQKFAALVNSHVEKMRAAGNAEVSFKVTVKDGKAHVTARPVKHETDGETGEQQ